MNTPLLPKPGAETDCIGADLCQSLPDRCKILTKSQNIGADLDYLWVSLVVLTGETEAARVGERTSILFIPLYLGLSKVKVGLRRNPDFMFPEHLPSTPTLTS